jgi:hypothetical protein
MHLAIASALILVACASASQLEPSRLDSVRHRLATRTELVVAATASSGEVIAQRYVATGWEDHAVTLAIADGALEVALDPDDRLALSGVAVSLRTIALPPSLLGRPAQLQDVRIALDSATTFTPTWRGDDDVIVVGDVRLDLSWTLSIGDGALPLATQHLPPLLLAMRLTGTGAQIDARIGVTGDGQLWSWADVLAFADLQLTLAAASSSEQPSIGSVVGTGAGSS